MSKFILADKAHEVLMEIFELPEQLTEYSIHLKDSGVAECTASFYLMWKKDKKTKKAERNYEQSLAYIKKTMNEAKEIYGRLYELRKSVTAVR